MYKKIKTLCPLIYCESFISIIKYNPTNTGAILGQNCLWLLGTALTDLFFSNKNFIKRGCIGVAQIRYALLKVFYREKAPFYDSAGHCLRFLK